MTKDPRTGAPVKNPRIYQAAGKGTAQTQQQQGGGSSLVWIALAGLGLWWVSQQEKKGRR